MSLSHLRFSFYNTTKAEDRNNNKAFLYYSDLNQGYFKIRANHNTTLTPGSLVAYQRHHFHPQGSLLYLFNLDHVMSDDEIRAMQFDPTWEAQHFGGGGQALYWALTPRTPQSISKGQSIQLTVPHWPFGNGKNKAFFNPEMTYFHAEQITHGAHPKHDHFKITFRDAPNVPKPPAPTDLFTTRSEAYLTKNGTHTTAPAVTITPEGEDNVVNHFQLVMHTSGYQSNFNTEFLISFVTGDGSYGAFASPTDQGDIRLSFEDEYPGWTMIPELDEQIPHWRVIPPANQALQEVVLNFNNVVTHLEGGWSGLYVQYRSLEGYRDGHVILPLYKYPVPQFVSDSYLFPGFPPLHLHWHLESMDSLNIAAVQSIDASCFLRLGSGPHHLEGHVSLTSVYALRLSVLVDGTHHTVAESVGGLLRFGPVAPSWAQQIQHGRNDRLTIEAKGVASDPYEHVCEIPIDFVEPTTRFGEQTSDKQGSKQSLVAAEHPLSEKIHFAPEVIYQGTESIGRTDSPMYQWNDWLVNDSSLVFTATSKAPEGWQPTGFQGERRFVRPLGYQYGP